MQHPMSSSRNDRDCRSERTRRLALRAINPHDIHGSAPTPGHAVQIVDPLREHSVVAIAGLGASGTAAARLLQTLGKSIVATDSRATLDVTTLPPGVDLRLGRLDIGDARVVVLTPGLNPEWPANRANPQLAALIARAERGEIALISEVTLAAQAAAVPLLTIGGTDGKSTTAALVHHLLRACGIDAILGGNSWTALADVVLDAPSAECVVAEVSAFQLWEGHTLHPRCAILTNIAPDHLDHYAGLAEYIAAKRHVLGNMTAGDHYVAWALDAQTSAFGPVLRARGVTFAAFAIDRADLPGDADVIAFVEPEAFVVSDGAREIRVARGAFGLPGAHNARNVLAALLEVHLAFRGDSRVTALGLEAGLRTFRGLPHRVELVRERAGVRFYNDSKATNVHAAVTGLRAFGEPLVAIVGGVDKNLDLRDLIDVLEHKARHVVVIGEIRQRFTDEAAGHVRSLEPAADMAEAVRLAARAAVPGDVVVLAPACSSFDMFRSFEHRGEVFADLVRQLPDDGG
jgi:UDP-N-acetylmuramoylalanine--D-glutamate ligase